MDSALSFLLLLAFATVSIKGARFTVFLGTFNFEADKIYFTANKLIGIPIGDDQNDKEVAEALKEYLSTVTKPVTEIIVQVNRTTHFVKFESTIAVEVKFYKEYYCLDFNYASLPSNLANVSLAREAFRDAMHQLLNHFRHIHNVGELIMDTEFKSKAQAYADDFQNTAFVEGYQLYQLKYYNGSSAPRGSIAAAYVADYWYEGSLKYDYNLVVTPENEEGKGLGANPEDCRAFILTVWFCRSILGIGISYKTLQSEHGTVEVMRAVQSYVPYLVYWHHDALKANVLKARDTLS